MHGKFSWLNYLDTLQGIIEICALSYDSYGTGISKMSYQTLTMIRFFLAKTEKG